MAQWGEMRRETSFVERQCGYWSGAGELEIHCRDLNPIPTAYLPCDSWVKSQFRSALPQFTHLKNESYKSASVTGSVGGLT